MESAAGAAFQYIKDQPELVAIAALPGPKEEKRAAAKEALRARTAARREKEREERGERSISRKGRGKGRGNSSGDENQEEKVSRKERSMLNDVCSKVVRRNLQKGEITYSTCEVNGGYQSKVTVCCLPGNLGMKPFQGQVCEKEQESLESAAAAAVKAIMSDKELKEHIEKPSQRSTSQRPPRTPRGERSRIEKKAKDGDDWVLSVTVQAGWPWSNQAQHVRRPSPLSGQLCSVLGSPFPE